MRSSPPINVLVVDDLEENLIALEALLRAEGRNILRARSGREALELLLVEDVALALLDVQMPEMNGFELAELMRGTERTKLVPIIFVSAGSHDAQRVFRGYEVGAVDFLHKPIDAVLLGHKVETFVNLYRQRLELAEALRLNELFMAAVSHDLRTPLSAVVAGTAVLERLTSDPTATRTVQVMRSSALRMTGMLDQLYELTRSRLGEGTIIEPRELEIEKLIHPVVEELRGAWPGREIHASYTHMRSLRAVWDGPKLAQVVANLLSNALRHGLPARPASVRVEACEREVSIHVHNEGKIAPEVREHMFEPFRQERGRRSREGLGLGLYIVREIVHAHRGRIEVRSDEATGTTFSVSLPRTASASPR